MKDRKSASCLFNAHLNLNNCYAQTMAQKLRKMLLKPIPDNYEIITTNNSKLVNQDSVLSYKTAFNTLKVMLPNFIMERQLLVY